MTKDRGETIWQMRIRQFELGRDYPEICEWWRAQKFPAIPLDALPRIGLIAEDVNHKYAAVFLYYCEANWAWLEWLVTNPRAPLRGRARAIDYIVEEALNVLRLSGVTRVMSSLRNENLVSVYEKHGFLAGDTGMTNLTCDLEQRRTS